MYKDHILLAPRVVFIHEFHCVEHDVVKPGISLILLAPNLEGFTAVEDLSTSGITQSNNRLACINNITILDILYLQLGMPEC